MNQIMLRANAQGLTPRAATFFPPRAATFRARGAPRGLKPAARQVSRIQRLCRDRLLLCVLSVVVVPPAALAGDWPFWRGPEQTGLAREKAVVTSWSPEGTNVVWKVPIGGGG